MTESRTSHLSRDLLGVATLGFTLFALLALATFSPDDPSFNKYSTQAAGVKNMAGLVGAYLADLLVQALGTGAFVFPLVTFGIGWSLIRGREFSRWPLVLSFGSLFLAGFCSLVGIRFARDPYFGAGADSGGMIGSELAEVLVRWLSPIGAQLVLFTLLCVALMAMLGLTTHQMIEAAGRGARALGRLALRGVHQLLGWMVLLFQESRQWKKEMIHILKTLKKEKARAPKRAEPVIVSGDLITPVPKKMDFPEESRKKKKEEKPEFAVQEDFPFMATPGTYQIPPVDLLNDPVHLRNIEKMREELMRNSSILEKKLADFGVEGRVLQVLPGPVITLYEFEPAPGIKVSRILSLTDDLALAMRAPSVRILAPVPGKSVVGIELPNPKRETVFFKEIMNSDAFRNTQSKLALAVGKDNIGQPVVQDLAQVPHLLMAGSTGSGKSVGINSMICSLLMNASPDEVKMIMIDPKMLELSMYDGIPHLIAPVVTNPKKAAAALQWAVTEMERRYKMMAEKSVRNITGYNQWVEKLEREAASKNRVRFRKAPKKPPVAAETAEGFPEAVDAPEVEPEIPARLPYVVIIIDELADLMMVASKGVEDSLTRLAQMARAAGIHLIVATQRPSVDVLTGIIKANFPARLSYQVTSRVDSRTILDSMGAEKLLGKGDMLFLPPGTSKLQRIHGAMVSDEEINRILRFIKEQDQHPDFEEDVFQEVADQESAKEGEEEDFDEKYDEAVALVARERQASISMLQRKLRVGYNRAARMIETMEREGVVGRSDGIKPRDVYVKPISIE